MGLGLSYGLVGLVGLVSLSSGKGIQEEKLSSLIQHLLPNPDWMTPAFSSRGGQLYFQLELVGAVMSGSGWEFLYLGE